MPQNSYYDAAFPLMSGGTGAWQVYRHQDVRNVLFDYETYGNSYMPDNGQLGYNVNQTDPPIHGVLRAIITPYFSRNAVSSLEPFIVETCSNLLKSRSGIINFPKEIAFPLTAAIISEILGVPEIEYSNINRWAKSIVTAGYVPDGLQKAVQAQMEMSGLFVNLLELRNNLPGEDLISALATATSDDISITIQTRIGTCITILLAGFETTANLLSQGVLKLAEDEGLQQELRRNPELLPQFILELLRLHPSLVSMYRVARKDVSIDGNLIKKGDIINAWINTANRDEDLFPDPQKLDLQRGNSNQGLSFGFGIHHCVGAQLAKTIAKITFEVLLSQYDSFSLSSFAAPVLNASLISPGFEDLIIVRNENA